MLTPWISLIILTLEDAYYDSRDILVTVLHRKQKERFIIRNIIRHCLTQLWRLRSPRIFTQHLENQDSQWYGRSLGWLIIIFNMPMLLNPHITSILTTMAPDRGGWGEANQGPQNSSSYPLDY
jgi:hypothetical protein